MGRQRYISASDVLHDLVGTYGKVTVRAYLPRVSKTDFSTPTIDGDFAHFEDLQGFLEETLDDLPESHVEAWKNCWMDGGPYTDEVEAVDLAVEEALRGQGLLREAPVRTIEALTLAYERGSSLETLGSLIGTDPSTIRRWFLELDVELREPKVGTGEDHPRSKLTPEDIHLIRTLYRYTDWSQREMAEHFPCGRSHIGRICRAEVWVEGPYPETQGDELPYRIWVRQQTTTEALSAKAKDPVYTPENGGPTVIRVERPEAFQ